MSRSFQAAVLVLLAAALPAAYAQQPSDPQIAAIVVTANQVDIDAGKLAISKGRVDAVRTFARQMVADHTGVNKQAVELVTKLKVVPEDNPTSQSLKNAQDANRTKLDALSGAAFDKAYADNEAAYHKTVDDALSNTLIPDAQNAELKSLLESGLKIFQDHLRDAQNMVKQLSVAHQ